MKVDIAMDNMILTNMKHNLMMVRMINKLEIKIICGYINTKNSIERKLKLILILKSYKNQNKYFLRRSLGDKK